MSASIRRGLASGSVRAASLSLLNTGSSAAESVNLRDIPFSDKTRELLFQHSFFSREAGSERWAGGAAVFFGWVRQPRRRLAVDDPRTRATDYTLYRAIVPLTGPEDDA